MSEYQKTTGKKYKGTAYSCMTCGKRYNENKKHECPACGSKDRIPYQQTTANLEEGDK